MSLFSFIVFIIIMWHSEIGVQIFLHLKLMTLKLMTGLFYSTLKFMFSGILLYWTFIISAKWTEWTARYIVMLFSFCPSVCEHSVFRSKYLENGLRQRLGTNYPLIGKGLWRIEWWRHRWRHVTLKGQGRDPNIFMARYFVQNSLGGYMHSLSAF